MSTMAMCPSVHALRALSTGRLTTSEAEVLRAHLAHCEWCRGVLEGMEATQKDVYPGEVGWTETQVDPTVAGTTVTADFTGPRPGSDPGSHGSTLRVDDGDEPDEELDLSFLLPSPRPTALGRIGEYDVLNVLGIGGMGIVFKAYDSTLHRIVAIKVMKPKLAASRRARRQFLSEARSAAAVNHPNVVTIHAVGTQHNLPYLVMECIGGPSLRHRIRTSGKSLAYVEILRISHQVAQGLAAAHEQGVIHRDIKPANIMLEDGVERVKITDFGLALAAMNFSDMTSEDKVVGTPAYMSPEQVRAEVLDARSDLFGMGCVIYAMATGHSPFKGAHTLEIIRKVAEHEPTPLCRLDPPMPRPLSDLVDRLLAKAPEDRPSSATEVAETLRGLLAEANLEPVAISGEHELAAGAALRAAQPAPGRSLTRRLAETAAMLALAVLLLAWTIYTLRSRPEADGPGQAQAAEVLPGAVDLTVGPGPDADYATAVEALQNAGPGSTIRLDNGTYDGALLINDPRHWAGLTIEPIGYGTPGARQPVLTSAEGHWNAVVELRDTPNVTIRGVTIESHEAQHGVFIGNHAEGVTVEAVHFRKPSETGMAHVFISEQARGSARAPIRVRNSTFELGTMGVVVEDVSGQVITSVRIQGNRFMGIGPHLMLSQNLRDVEVTGNIFIGGRSVTLDLKPTQRTRFLLANNSFFNVMRWIEGGTSDPDRARAEIVNNAIFGLDALDPDGNLGRLNGPWRFEKNLWEAAPGRGSPLAEPGSRLEVRSRDPSDPDFLRPAPGSRLLGAGAGGDLPDHVGALGPAPDEPGN
jgi:tRNA A-37 threonylcarbamoyl transferase component Bud32